MNSLEFKSKGMIFLIAVDKPNNTLIQLRKKKVGPNKYKNGIRKTQSKGKRSSKKLKKRTSAIKKIEPGNPKKIKQLIKLIKNSLGHKKLTPLISVINLVLNRLLIASTKKKELEDNRAWLMSMQKLVNIIIEYPVITHIVNQCISTTVE
jgi:hypothetical protein